jgi:hypothetical protein
MLKRCGSRQTFSLRNIQALRLCGVSSAAFSHLWMLDRLLFYARIFSAKKHWEKFDSRCYSSFLFRLWFFGTIFDVTFVCDNERRVPARLAINYVDCNSLLGGSLGES